MGKTWLLMVSLMIMPLSCCLGQNMNPEFIKTRGTASEKEAYLRSFQHESDELYKYEKELMEIHEQIAGYIDRYRKKIIDKEEARVKIKELLKEKMRIMTDPDYRVEQELMRLLAPRTASERIK